MWSLFPRAFESTVLEKLLEWGQSSIDKSVNQPTLPHAVIVINATDKVDEKEWDVAEATRRFLNDIREAIDRDPRFGAYAQNWRRYRRIETTEDLLKCYYASITVVRVPASPRYMLIDTQVSKLFNVIQSHCRTSLITKKQARMLANADKLQIYLQAAYDHFTLNLHEPFDFVKEALKHSPISRDFGGNILKLALSIKESCSWIQGRTQLVFEYLADMIAHCIFLDSVRQGLMGTSLTFMLLFLYIWLIPQQATLSSFWTMHTFISVKMLFDSTSNGTPHAAMCTPNMAVAATSRTHIMPKVIRTTGGNPLEAGSMSLISTPITKPHG